MSKDTYIIIPVYNRKAITLQCLKMLKDTGDLDRYQVAIVDDGSTDGTREMLEQYYPQVMVLPGDGNLWWTGAIAKGMTYAYDRGAKHFFWLNDDCIPESNTLSQLVEFMQANPDTIVAPTCYNPDTHRVEDNGFQGRTSCAATPGEVREVDGVCGWCVGIPRSVFSKIGAPDARKFPQYSGDDTYTLRATRAGFKVCLLGDAKVTLAGGVRVTHHFDYYIKPGKSARTTLTNLFLSKKSPYYLPTKFYYYTERYGLAIGMLMFMTKIGTWLPRWMQIQFKLKASI